MEYIELDDDDIELMAPFLADNHIFKCLKVVVNDSMNDMTATSSCLASFLLMFDNLTEFNLSYEGNIVDYFDIVIQALTVHTRLMQLTFNNIDIRRRGRDSLVKLLNKSTHLKELHFSNIMGIINDGPSVIIPLLQDPKFILEELSLVNDNAAHDAHSITNEGIEILTDALAVNCRLKCLVLTGHHSITEEGWMIFSVVLRNPNSQLEKLVLYRNYINDNVLNSFAEALTSNRKLQDLRIDCSDSATMNGGYAALTCNLCDKSSILSTYHSNHILKMLPYIALPNDLSSLLKINIENSANQAARLKIINTHFQWV